MGALPLRTDKINNLNVVHIKRQNDGQIGIENVKTILTIVIAFFTDLITAIKSKNYFLLLNIVGQLLKYGNIVFIAQEAWKEIKDTSQAESAVIVNHIKSELDLENDNLEAQIESAIEVIPEIYQLVLDVLGLAGRGQELYNRLRVLFRRTGDLQAAA